MHTGILKKWFLFSLLGLMAFALPEKKRVSVWLIGDSTMCTYGASRFPLTGWGMPFANYFDSAVTVKNRARGGRSTRTFLSEGLWTQVMDSLVPGDYVFIQFGHNDESASYPDRYTPPDDYRKNLITLVNATREKKGFPVLITPVSRRKFDSSGQAVETHPVYSDIVREIALKYKVPLIDLDKASMQLYQRYGPEDSKLLFNLLAPGENPNYPNGLLKNATHFNAYGARKIAELVLQGMETINLPLVKYIVRN